MNLPDPSEFYQQWAARMARGLHMYAILYRTESGLHEGERHTSRECALDSVTLLEGADVVGVIELLPEPVKGMQFALKRYSPVATVYDAMGSDA